MRKLFHIIIFAVLAMSLVCPVFADGIDTEQQTAAAYLRKAGIMAGNESGDMTLDQSLTRAQMAAILTCVVANPEHIKADSAYYSSRCSFTDVPDWAKPYVGYCTANYFVAGYGNGIYGSNDPVTPAAACTVMLRCLGDIGIDWNYDTACQTAIELELAPAEALMGTEITRGNMAVLVYRTMAKMGYDIELTDNTVTPVAGEAISNNPDGSINVPSDGSRYIPKAGDVIRCDDGSNYTITDVIRYDSNVFASGPVGELPDATCDWSRFPELELPKAEVRHFSNSSGEVLFIRNLYETRRMQYTIYNTLGNESSAWRCDEPLATVELSIPADLELHTGAFWPWRESELTDLVHSRPNSKFYVEAWDYYLKGVFQYTRYCVVSW